MMSTPRQIKTKCYSTLNRGVVRRKTGCLKHGTGVGSTEAVQGVDTHGWWGWNRRALTLTEILRCVKSFVSHGGTGLYGIKLLRHARAIK